MQGAVDCVIGKKDPVVGSATGDHGQQHLGEARENKGDWKESIDRKLKRGVEIIPYHEEVLVS
ncbi:uncharacterized protein SCHCODRAFT_02611457 [Schizophyllum commune H4-8]|uniref:uncharacterized protein n=1 Tax=Schizophyllum commune (strain H4-8 / FGSC 9210) TaxID=578458 RepID=UPI002160295D|nr:uncharacterized protein SCHCODRAFT_02611457 [Schizophyllum commune H4-8]KAI5898221.1 hypothetical protein SCHCODRAFT_02611457 [Schizophyllum commune H4-8]